MSVSLATTLVSFIQGYVVGHHGTTEHPAMVVPKVTVSEQKPEIMRVRNAERAAQSLAN